MSEALGKGEDLFTLLGIFSGEVSWSDGAVMAAHFGYLSSSLYIPCSFSLPGTLHGPKKYAHTQNHTASPNPITQLSPSIPLSTHLGIPSYNTPLRSLHPASPVYRNTCTPFRIKSHAHHPPPI
jgi:hypothetical protein